MCANKALLINRTYLNEETVPGLTKTLLSAYPNTPISGGFTGAGTVSFANLTLLVRLGLSGSLYTHALSKSQLVHKQKKS